jgi:hypothetical protein
MARISWKEDSMPFRRQVETTAQQILEQAAAEADRLGVEEYLIVIRRRGALVTISDESELRPGDVFVGIVTDAKGGGL